MFRIYKRKKFTFIKQIVIENRQSAGKMFLEEINRKPLYEEFIILVTVFKLQEAVVLPQQNHTDGQINKWTDGRTNKLAN